MKIALCISGQSRFFKTSFQSLKSFLLDDFDCDIFISTWDFQNIPENQLGSLRYQDEGTLKEFIDLYQPKAYCIEVFDKLVEDFYIAQEQKYMKPNYRQDNYLRRYLPMLYRIYICNQLRKNYEQHLSFKYDMIIRSRSDILYSIKFKDLIKFDKPLYNDIYGNGRSGSGDIFSFGTSDGLDAYCDLFSCLDSYDGRCQFNTEILLDYHLQQRNMDYELINCGLEIIRPKDFLK